MLPFFTPVKSRRTGYLEELGSFCHFHIQQDHILPAPQPGLTTRSDRNSILSPASSSAVILASSPASWNQLSLLAPSLHLRILSDLSAASLARVVSSKLSWPFLIIPLLLARPHPPSFALGTPGSTLSAEM